MNNYIPLNKAVGPVCIYDGSEPLIDKKLGVEATECRFDGSECEHASCSGNVYQGGRGRPLLFWP